MTVYYLSCNFKNKGIYRVVFLFSVSETVKQAWEDIFLLLLVFIPQISLFPLLSLIPLVQSSC